MTALDDLPDVNSFFGIDLKTGSMIIAALGISRIAWKMTALDDLPDVNSFFGIDLKTGSMIIAALGIVHPMAYGCSFFIPISYLLVTIWILVALYFSASAVLFVGLFKNDPELCSIWVWYAVVFVALMLMMMVLLALVFTSRRQKNMVFFVIIGILWYILTIYFVLVVNSYRKKLAG